MPVEPLDPAKLPSRGGLISPGKARLVPHRARLGLMTVTLLRDALEVAQRGVELGLLEGELHVVVLPAPTHLHRIRLAPPRRHRFGLGLMPPQHIERLLGHLRQLAFGSEPFRFAPNEDVEHLLLGGRGAGRPHFGVVMLVAQPLVEERPQFRRHRHAKLVTVAREGRTQSLHLSARVPHERAVGNNHARQTRRGHQRMDVVRLPKRQPRVQRGPVPSLERARNFHRASMHMDAHWCFQERPPEREQQAQPGLLDEPGPMCVHVEDDVRNRGAVCRLVVQQPFGIEAADPIPVPAGVPQDRVVEPPNILPLPEALGVLLVGPRALMLGAEVEAHQVQHPRHRRSARAVHTQNESLHQRNPDKLSVAPKPPHVAPFQGAP